MGAQPSARIILPRDAGAGYRGRHGRQERRNGDHGRLLMHRSARRTIWFFQAETHQPPRQDPHETRRLKPPLFHFKSPRVYQSTAGLRTQTSPGSYMSRVVRHVRGRQAHGGIPLPDARGLGEKWRGSNGAGPARDRSSNSETERGKRTGDRNRIHAPE